jgi:glycerol-3-phosphate dehydrogenase
MTISEAEIEYLCMLSNQYFKQTISSKDVLWSYSGVRPLVDDGTQDAKAITRNYHLELENHGAPILHVFGGKITTYRRLAEDALNLIAPVLNCHAPSWTASACLPGGDIVLKTADSQNVTRFESFVAQCCVRYDWLPQKTVKRYAHSYGTRIFLLLEGCSSLANMGPSILENLYAREVEYLMQHEYAQTAKDILWRRTKLGLHSQQDAEAILELWISKRRQSL